MNVLTYFIYWTSFCSMYNLTSSSPSPPSSFPHWGSLWQTPTEGVTWTPPSPLSLCLYHSIHLVFPRLAATEQLHSALRMWREGPPEATMPPSRLRQTLSLSLWKVSPESVMELREQWTSDPDCHPSSSKHWTQSWPAPTFTQRRHTTQLQLCSGVTRYKVLQ